MREKQFKAMAKKLADKYFKGELQLCFSIKDAFEKTEPDVSYRTFKRFMEQLQERGALGYTKISKGRAKGVQNIVTWINRPQLNKIVNG